MGKGGKMSFREGVKGESHKIEEHLKNIERQYENLVQWKLTITYKGDPS